MSVQSEKVVEARLLIAYIKNKCEIVQKGYSESELNGNIHCGVVLDTGLFLTAQKTFGDTHPPPSPPSSYDNKPA